MILENMDKIIISTQDSHYVIDTRDIVYCKSDNSYTTFFIQNRKDITASISIKKVEEQLQAENFIRPHQSYLVNPLHVQSISKNQDTTINLIGGKEVPISKRLKKGFFEQLEKIVSHKINS